MKQEFHRGRGGSWINIDATSKEKHCECWFICNKYPIIGCRLYSYYNYKATIKYYITFQYNLNQFKYEYQYRRYFTSLRNQAANLIIKATRTSRVLVTCLVEAGSDPSEIKYAITYQCDYEKWWIYAGGGRRPIEVPHSNYWSHYNSCMEEESNTSDQELSNSI